MYVMLKKIIKKILYRPKNIVAGMNSFVMLPRLLLNKERIFLGDNVFIGPYSHINPIKSYKGMECAGLINIESNVHVGGNCQIHVINRLNIGEGSVLSEYVYVSDASHGEFNPRDGLIMDQPLISKGPVSIGRGVFVGFGASVLPGVSLGDHCVVGARSVVTRSFPAYSMVVGAPARLVKVFDQESRQWISASDA